MIMDMANVNANIRVVMADGNKYVFEDSDTEVMLRERIRAFSAIVMSGRQQFVRYDDAAGNVRIFATKHIESLDIRITQRG